MPENIALLPLSAGSLLDLLRSEAVEHDLPLTEHRGRVDVQTEYGVISAKVDHGCVRLVLTSEDEGGLHVLRDAVHTHLGDAQTLDWSGIQAGLPANLTVLSLAEMLRVSPSYTRLRLVGKTERLTHGGYHVRLIAPGAGSRRWPEVTAKGRTIWVEDTALPHRPVYTIVDVQNGALEVDVSRHIGGRTTRWVDTLRPGDEVGLMGPGGGGLPQAKRLSLWGDETALPAIRRIMQEAPEDVTGTATIVVPDAKDMSELPASRFDIRWLPRDCGRNLRTELNEGEGPDEGAFFWFAAGQDDVKIARQVASERGIAKQDMHIALYWK